MCARSVIGHHYDQKWERDMVESVFRTREVSRKEFEALKREVSEMKALLKKADEYDKRTGQADCEDGDKMDKLRKIAAIVGVSLDDVLGPAIPDKAP